MDYLQLTQYFEGIARQLVAISHSDQEQRFFEGIPDEVLQNANTVLSPQAMILVQEPYILRTNDSGSDNHQHIWEVDLNVVQAYNYQERDFKRLQEIWNDTLLAALQIRSRIWIDHLNFHHSTNDVIRLFEMKSCAFYKVDIPINGHFVGTRIELTFHTKGIDYEPSRWIDGNPYTQ